MVLQKKNGNAHTANKIFFGNILEDEYSKWKMIVWEWKCKPDISSSEN